MNQNDTICAISTSPGYGAIAIIRTSGPKSIELVQKIISFKSVGKKLGTLPANTVHLATVSDGENVIDDVLVSIFKKPYSYTGETMIEISSHGSIYIQQKILKLLIKSGGRIANPGEFTFRAFMNGKMDLSQAEAVADLIASQSETSHRLAFNQMRGGFSNELHKLRNQLLDFVSLIELELDFSEEDVEFADRTKLKNLISTIKIEIYKLLKSFDLGNVIKNGVPVVIIGNPNVGKSTILNGLLKEDKAIVTEIAGTTRDFIEDTININGVLFRLIDTAGLRKSTDKIESIGIQKTLEKIDIAKIILLVCDAQEKLNSIQNQIKSIEKKANDKILITILNKIDKISENELDNIIRTLPSANHQISICAQNSEDIHKLSELVFDEYQSFRNRYGDIIVSNTRHYEALLKANEAINRVSEGLKNNISTDLLTQDIRDAMHYLGEITGEITTDDILGNIFNNFCIGK